MTWPTVRQFLQVPPALTGKGVAIAVIDGDFPAHPDIATNTTRRSFVVQALEPGARPVPLTAESGPWSHGAHSLWAAAAAGGSGALCGGRYAGIAPEADLYLIRHWSPERPQDRVRDHAAALRWVLHNHQEYSIRGVLTALAGQRDTGLLPWQTDLWRVLCEELAEAGVLVVAGAGNMTDFTCRMSEAAAPSVLAVGGVVIPADGDAGKAPAYHGCRGVTFEGTWVPQVLAPAENIVLPWGSDEMRRGHVYAGIDRLPEGYARTEGTSFAGPIALGAAACIWQAHPEWTAHQMQAAILHTASRQPQWAALRAGLVSVADAVAAVPGAAMPSVAGPYARWRAWRQESVEDRLLVMGGADAGRATEAVLSFLPDALPTVALPLVRSLARHRAPRLRTAALCALATRPGDLTVDDVLPMVGDGEPGVRMAALDALDRCPHVWNEAVPSLIETIRDPSADVAYWAIRLAGRLRHPDAVVPLIAGLEADAREGRIACFGARCLALTALTGQEFPLDPPWRDGNCPYAEERRQARLGIAARWQASLTT